MKTHLVPFLSCSLLLGYAAVDTATAQSVQSSLAAAAPLVVSAPLVEPMFRASGVSATWADGRLWVWGGRHADGACSGKYLCGCNGVVGYASPRA